MLGRGGPRIDVLFKQTLMNKPWDKTDQRKKFKPYIVPPLVPQEIQDMDKEFLETIKKEENDR